MMPHFLILACVVARKTLLAKSYFTYSKHLQNGPRPTILLKDIIDTLLTLK